ncbi:hypothetical protein [Streptomyces tubercidicus]
MPLRGVPAPEYFGALLFQPRRLACAECGAVANWTAEERGAGLVGAVPGGTEDPFFRRPLWLQTRCAGRVLRAYDEEHVDVLDAYVRARLRERRASPHEGDVRPRCRLFRGGPRPVRLR